jgi:Spy/CpxP family protein refolding chaperone
MKSITTLVFTGTVLLTTAAIAQNVSDANIDILMQKIKADKKLLISQNMDLTDTEAEQFWPLYDSFQNDLAGVNQRMANTIKDYAATINKGPIPTDAAKKLVNDALAEEADEVKMKRSYVDKLGQVLPSTKVARYIQMETKIRSLLRRELAQQIPLIY